MNKPSFQSQPEPKPRKRSRTIPLLTLIALSVMAVICIGGGAGYWLWTSEPTHWTENQQYLAQHSETQLANKAELLEQRLTDEISMLSIAASQQQRALRASQQASGDASTTTHAEALKPSMKTIKMSIDEANAWLDQRLDDWLVNQGHSLPDGISEPMISSNNGKLVAAFQYSSPEVSQVVSLYFDLQVTPGGMAELKLDSVTGGSLPLPMQQIAERMANRADASETAQRMVQAFEGQQFDPVKSLDGGKQMRLMDFQATAEGLEFTVVVEPQP